MEKRTDMYLSTLRKHIQAMGGELDIATLAAQVHYLKQQGIQTLIVSFAGFLFQLHII